MGSDGREAGRRRTRIAIRVGLLLACAVLLVLASRVSTRRPLKPYPAPDFTLRDLRGVPVRLSDFKGKAVVLNFWATWCAPCRVEIPWFIEAEKEYGARGLEIVGVSVDEGGAAAIAPFVRKAGMDYPVLMDDGRASVAYGATEVLPTTYYITRDGRVVASVRGLASKDEVERNIEEILAGPATAAVGDGRSGR